MKKKAAPEESKSLKTFLLYSIFVILLILVAFIIKAFFVFQQSTFDGKSHFTLAISKTDRVEEIVSFNPADNTIHVLKLTNTQIPTASLGKFLAVIPDAHVDVPKDFEVTGDIEKMMWQMSLKYNFVKSDATILDIVRLALFSKNVPLGNRVIEERTLTKETIAKEKEMNKLIVDLFIDTQLSAENVSIQIINASAISGLGSRLERVLTNMGGNVVSVSTSRNEESVSKIQYFGNETYTLKKLKHLLAMPVLQLDKETIANIVIILGKDSANAIKF